MGRPGSRRKAGKGSVKKRSGGKGWAKRDFLTHAEGRVFIQLLGLASVKEWKEWSKSGQRPSNIPSAPYKVYRGKGWVSYMDFLGYNAAGKGHVKGDYLPYEQARAWVQQRKIKSYKEWKEWSKSGQRPSNIPGCPDHVYRGKGWVSWPDWLGCARKTGHWKKCDYLHFEDARAWVRQRNLKRTEEWYEWSKSGQRPSNIPGRPDKVYRGKGWVSWTDWLGKNANANGKFKQGEYLTYEDARAWPLCPVTTNIGHLACVHTFHVHCLDPLAHASAGPSTSSRRGVLINCPLCRKRCRYLPPPTEDGNDEE
eukprot:g1590.t1